MTMIESFVKERNEALFSLDRRKIEAYLVKYSQNAGTTTTGLLHKQRGCIYSKSQDEYYAGKEARHGKIVYA